MTNLAIVFVTGSEKLIKDDPTPQLKVPIFQDFDHICRCCSTKSTYSNIFKTVYRNYFLSQLYKDLLSTTLDLTDQLPHHLCESCVAKLIRFHKFKKMCQETETSLHSALKHKLDETNKELLDKVIPEIKFENIPKETDYNYSKLESNFSPTKNEEFICQYCCKVYRRKDQLNHHILSHTSKRSCLCSICGKTFICLQGLNSHMNSHKDEEKMKKNHKCQTCGEGFSQILLLKIHKLTHDNDKPYQCSHCEQKFFLQSNLKIHMRYHREDAEFLTNEKFAYKCNICGRSFGERRLLRRHVGIHGKKRYLCNVCGYRFHLKLILNKHMKLHANKKRNIIKCEYCRKWIDNINLRGHINIHSGDTPYWCKVCAKSLKTLTSLTTHLKLHCTESTEKFKKITKLSLKKSRGGEYTCSVCLRKFYSAIRLKKHQISHKIGHGQVFNRNNKKMA